MPPPHRRQCNYPACRSGPPGPNGEENPFITAEGNTTREQVAEELKTHIEMAHLLPIRLEENRTKTTMAEAEVLKGEAAKIREETAKIIAQNNANSGSSGSASPSSRSSLEPTDRPARPFTDKRDALPRPTITENITTADWGFFKSQ